VLLALVAPRRSRADPSIEIEVQGDAIGVPPKEPSVAGGVVRQERLNSPGLEAGDALRTQPGVAIAETGGYGAPTTASVRGATSAQTPVYLAGVRLNDDVGGAADLSTIPLWFLNRIEIYRSNAPLAGDQLGIGGAIFFEPRRAEGPEASAGAMAGSFGARAAWARAGVGNEKASALVGVRLDGAQNDYSYLNDGGTRFERSNDHTSVFSNPHDYLELAVNKAYVSRYESNPKPGQAPLDAGGDLLIVDPQANQITGRVELSTEPDGVFLPRADQLLLVGSDVWVLLQRFDADFKTAGDARLVGVDPVSDAITWTLDLPGIANCGGVARSPSGKVVALACSGVDGDVDSAQNPAPTLRSAVVLLDATVQPPVVVTHFAAAAALGAPIGSTIAFANETTLISVALGDSTTQRTDVAFTLDTTLGVPQLLLDAGAAFALGDVRCAPGCTDLCFLADAQANALEVWKVSGNRLSAQPSIATDASIGLPPRAIGAL